MTKRLLKSVPEKTYNKAPAVVHSNDMDIVASVIDKRRRSSEGQRTIKGQWHRPMNYEAFSNNYDLIFKGK